MDLTGKQRRHLRALAHHLNPVVMVGRAGLTDAVAHSVDEALTQHELIKVRVDADAPEGRDEIAVALAARLGASCVLTIGHVLALYRRHPTAPTLSLPDLPAPPKPTPSEPRRATKRPLRTRQRRER